MPDIKVLSEIPGKVLEIEAGVGDAVDEDDTLVMLESMKMEIPVPSPSEGTVKEILVAVDDMIEEGDPVAIIET